jgi:hypothetical protein
MELSFTKQMSSGFSNYLKENAKISFSVLVSIVFVLINAIGLFVSQAGSSTRNGFNPIGLSWYFMAIYILWIILLLSFIGKNALTSYRHFLNSLTIIVLVALPMDIERSLINKAGAAAGSSLARGSITSAVGNILFIFPVVLSIFI